MKVSKAILEDLQEMGIITFVRNHNNNPTSRYFGFWEPKYLIRDDKDVF